MHRLKPEAMDLGEENMFVRDPFLSLDNDLDDVSEVIRSNIVGEQSAGGLFDASRTPSPQYLRDTDIYVPMEHLGGPYGYGQTEHDKEIGQIVSLLQDDVQMPSSSSAAPSRASYSTPFHIKPDHAATQMEFPSPAATAAPYGLQPQNYEFGGETAPPPFSYYPSNLPSSSTAIPNGYANGVQYAQMRPPPPTGYGPMVVDDYPPAQPAYEPPRRDAADPANATKHELIKMLLEMTPSDFERLRTERAADPVAAAKPQEPPPQPLQRPDIATLTPMQRPPQTPAPLDPVRKKPSLNLQSLQQPLLLAMEGPSTLQSPIDSNDGFSSPFSPSIVSPKSSPDAEGVDWREDSDGEPDYPRAIRKGPKTERRTAHNLIEKKYRCSINDRINHLKEMLAPEEAKLSKSATLRKAIDHINALRQQNLDLIHENELLKQQIKTMGGDVPMIGRSFARSNIVSRDTSESPLSAQSSKSSSPRGPVNKRQHMMDQSKVTLCALMFMVVLCNPFAAIFGSSSIGQVNASDQIVGKIPVQHRTLKSFGDYPFETDAEETDFWHRTFTRHALIWITNLLIVFLILTRLLVHGEPVADRRSPTWIAFQKTRKHAANAIAACNYKEAQRQLSDALRVLGRPLPKPGGLEELMSILWQMIRHVLNAIWVGRWFSRRRRSENLSAPVVCRSHGITALVYHQLHQLHLLGVDALDNGRWSGLHLALCAVNLAESAGIQKDNISHSQRADIYVHAAFRMKLSLPPFLAQITSGYFLRRARRHVRKSSSVDNVEMNGYRWIFHPLARNFLRNTEAIREILQSSQHLTHAPFCIPPTSPKPVDRLTSAFKMHLLALLMQQLHTSSSNLRLTDFVEISHLLLEMCTAETTTASTTEVEGSVEEETPPDWEKATTQANGDELCTWWAHTVTCGLYWKYGDAARARKHYALIRRCPPQLRNCNLALAFGKAFCARKFCTDDRDKKAFADMVWVHVSMAFSHILKDEPLSRRKTSKVAIALNQMVRCLTFEWINNSLLDVWQRHLNDKQLHWEQIAPSRMRRLYQDSLTEYRHSATAPSDRLKIAVFKVLGRLLDGANPLTTWRLLSCYSNKLNDDEPNNLNIQKQLATMLSNDLRSVAENSQTTVIH